MPSPNILRTQDVQPADGEALLWACDQRDARTLSPGVLNDALNLRYTDGLPETRKGVVKPGWANFTSSSSQNISSLGTPYGSGVFRDPNGVEWQMVAAGGFVWRSRPANANQTVPLPTGVAILGRCKFVQAFDRIFLFRGQFLAPLVMADFDDGFIDILPHYDATETYNATVVATGQTLQEIAYGPFQAVTSLTLVGSTATVVTPQPHGYITGADITVQGANQSAYNSRFNITVIDDVTFTFQVFGAPASPATGTIKVSNMIYYWQALGSLVTLTSLTSSSTTATATKTAHGFSTGQYVTIAGAAQPEYNGTFQITVTGANTFTYVFAGSVTSPATGTITAQTSIVLAGQSPDTNPEAWTRTYNILPNADTALFINDLLLVPTAYQPASVDDFTTFNGGTYVKTDYIVATNYLDYIHFSFVNEFRINAGGADEIVDLFPFGSGSVVVLKDKSYWGLATLTTDLTQVTLTNLSTEYGCVGRGAWTVVGSNAYFLSASAGIVVIRQSDLGVLLGVNVPLTAPVQKAVNGIDWPQAALRARLSHWDSKLYMSVPMTDGTPTIFVFDFIASVRLGNSVWETGVMVQGWTPCDTGSALDVLEFHRMYLNGQQRHFFLDTAGYVNLMEESDVGDQIVDPSGPQGLRWEEIESYALSRAYEPSLKGQVRPTEECISLMTFNPNYTVKIIFAGVGLVTTLVADCTRDNTKYTKPFAAARWDVSNVNNDWGTPYREDYHIALNEPPNLIPAGAAPIGGGGEGTFYQPITPGAKYTLTVNDNPNFLTVQMATYDPVTGFAYDPVGLPGFAVGIPCVFTAANTYSGPPQFRPTGGSTQPLILVIGITTTDPLINAVLTGPCFQIGSGVALLQYQEALDTRRAAGRQNKSFQLEFTNTSGRIRLVGQRISAVPGRDRRGVLN